MRPPKILDNKSQGFVYKELQESIKNGSKLSVISALFSMYAYDALKKDLNKIENMRFIYTKPSFIKNNEKEAREYYIDNNDIFGNDFEIKLKNEMTQSAISKEFTNWLREKTEIKSFKIPNEAQPRMICVDNTDESTISINGTVDFTTAGLGLTKSNRQDINNCVYGEQFVESNLMMFNTLWNDDNLLEDVKDEVLEQMKTMHKENPAEFIYFLSLYNIFSDNLEALDEDKIVRKGNQIKETQIWNKLYEYQQIKKEILEVVEKPTKNLRIRDANKKCKVKLNKQVYLSDDFKEFWDSIKHKTTYAVEYNTDELVNKCVKAIEEHLNVKSPKLLYTKSGLTVEASGVNYDENGIITTAYSNEDEIALPDIVTYLQNETDLTRRTIIRILNESDTLNQFKKNPQEYMQEISKLINKVMSHLIIDGIKYTKINDSYSQELFKNSELFGYLEKNMVEAENSVYDHIIYDSETEKNFALRLDNDPEVKLYAKLPNWFKINTPLGNYNPDWAIMLDKDGETKMYFVVETKGTIEYLGNRPREESKIRCGRKHFEAIGNEVKFEVSETYETFKTKIAGE